MTPSRHCMLSGVTTALVGMPLPTPRSVLLIREATRHVAR